MLKDSWSGEKKPKTPVLPTTEKYLEQVREKLRETQQVVARNLEKSQREMEDQYNEGRVPKKFDTGDLVLYLMPTSTNRLLSNGKGQGP